MTRTLRAGRGETFSSSIFNDPTRKDFFSFFGYPFCRLDGQPPSARPRYSLSPAPPRMGVPGLLPFLKSASQETHLEAYRGQRVAVDASCWLHRGAISCAKELVTGQPTLAFCRFPMRMVRSRTRTVPASVADRAARFRCRFRFSASTVLSRSWCLTVLPIQ